MQQAEIALPPISAFHFCNEILSPRTQGAFIALFRWGARGTPNAGALLYGSTALLQGIPRAIL